MIKLFFCIVAIFLVKHSKCSTCNSTISPSECCPENYKELCCPSIPHCHGMNKGKTHPSHHHVCYHNDDNAGCNGGFATFLNQSTIPCPQGWYCPAEMKCAIPCLKGGYCPKTIVKISINHTSWGSCVKGVSNCCTFMNGEVANVRSNIISGRLMCAGISTDAICPPNFYCPNTTSKIPCINTGACPQGSTTPLRCNLFRTCSATRRGISEWIGIEVLIILFLLILLLHVLHSNRRTIKYCIFDLLNLTQKQSKPKSKGVSSGLTTVALHCFGGEDSLIKMKEFKVDIGFSKVDLEIDGQRILSDVFGSFRNSRLSAIMGPSGSGKTTLVNILRGKILKKCLKGKVKLNGIPMEEIENFNSIIGFAPQDDIMHESLTVKEVLHYEANLHSSQNTSITFLQKYVMEVMTLLGITSIADDYVGDVDKRGLSGGQKRRLNLGMELVTNPTILFCDEPTSGLDSSTGLEVMRMLRNIAENTGINIICVIHQPRYESYILFHDILLLSATGKVIYEGEVQNAHPYFQSLGFDFNAMTNPADFIIDIANGTSMSSACNSSDLPSIWKERVSDKNNTNNECVERVNVSVDDHKKIIIPIRQSWIRQTGWFYKREFILQVRSIRLLITEVFIIVVVGGILGGIYTETVLADEMGKTAMTSLCVGMLSLIPSMKYFSNNWNVLLREADGGINRFSFFVAINLISFPIMVFVYPLAFLSLYHTISDTRTSFGEHYVNVLCSSFTLFGIGQLISTAVQHNKMHIVAVGVVLISTLCGGSSISLCDMDKITFIGPVLYSLSYSRWFIEAQFECESRYFSDILMKQLTIYGRENHYSFNNRHLCLIALIAIGVGARILAFIAILIRTR